MQHDTNLQAALAYLKEGRSVFPLEPGKKKPLEHSIKQYQTRRLTEEQAVRLWTANPDAGIGMYLGKVSGGLIALDVDDDDGGFFRYIVADPEKLDTPLIKTHGERRQIWYLFPPEKCPGRDILLKDVIEVRGNGHYSVVPPSQHPTGQRYEFLNGVREPKFIEDVVGFVGMLRARAEEWPYVKAALPQWTPGRRQDLTLGLAGFFRKRLGWDEARARTVIENLTRMAGDEETYQRMTAVQSTFRKRVGDVAVGQYLGKELAGALAGALLAGALQGGGPGADLGRFYMDGRLKPGRVAEWQLEKHTFKTLDDTEEVLRYDDEKGVYAPAEPAIKAAVQAALGMDKCSTNAVNEVLGHIKRSTYTPRRSFDADHGIINVENGLLNVEERTLAPHTPEYLSRVQLPLRFEAGADCPGFKEFLSEVLPEDQHAMMQEAFGYCLLKSTPIHVANFLLGSGANGKSTLLKVLKVVLGRDNVVSVAMQELGLSRFAAAVLDGKLANIYPELPPKRIRDSGMFKAVVSGDPLKAERKFQSPFTLESFAKHFFSANALPPTDDPTDAFYRRVNIFIFPNQFVGTDATNQDELVAGMTSPGEKSGILNWMLIGLERLLRQGEFTGTETIEAIRKNYTLHSDPVGAFVEECLGYDPRGEVTKADLYQRFVEYCRSKNPPLLAPSPNVFSNHLARAMPEIRSGRASKGKPRPWVWKGVVLEENEDENEDDAGRGKDDAKGGIDGWN